MVLSNKMCKLAEQKVHINK